MYSELCISTDSRVSHIQWGHVSLIDRLHSCTGQSTVIISRLPTFPPHTLLIQPHTFPQPSSFCASYLFILFSASILLPLAQVLTPRLSCRLMIRALLCLSLFFPLWLHLIFTFLKLTYANSSFGAHSKHSLTNIAPWENIKRAFTSGLKHKLTESSNFDEDRMKVWWYHLREQGLLVSPPQVGQWLQTKPQTSGKQVKGCKLVNTEY